MPEFEDIYAARAGYVYLLCFRLEGDAGRAERLFADVWKRAHESLPEGNSYGEVTIRLCQHVVDSHRILGRMGHTVGGSKGEMALSRLAPEYRLPLVLKEVGGLSYSGIALALDVPEPTVRARMGRARTLLRSAHAGNIE